LINQAWQYTPVDSALRRLRQEDYEFTDKKERKT
jgi:hypothetical protein